MLPHKQAWTLSREVCRVTGLAHEQAWTLSRELVSSFVMAQVAALGTGRHGQSHSEQVFVCKSKRRSPTAAYATHVESQRLVRLWSSVHAGVGMASEPVHLSIWELEDLQASRA